MENYRSWNKHRTLQIVAIFATAVALYATNFSHAFHLDSQYGLVENQAIERLANIPSYFTDPFTLTSLRTNADYRPILQITYALNYAISGREVWSWHLVQILLHVFNAGCLMALTAFLLPRLLKEPTHHLHKWVPFVVGALFLIHPTASGVVNYLWARSTLLTTAFLLPTILCFMRGRNLWAALLYSLALFTKVEAVGALGVCAMWLVLIEAEKRQANPDRTGDFIDDLGGILTRPALITMAPMMAITLAYAGLRYWLLPDFLAEVRSDPGMTTLGYFSTQLTAWWYYIGHWWAPIDLVADHLTYPRYMALKEPMVLLALFGWGIVACVLGLLYRTRPVYAFLAVSALALISPHSSFLPLTEMVNEHRPYLAVGLLSMCWIVPSSAFLLGRTIESWTSRQTIGVVALVSLIAGFGVATHARNQIFLTWDSYWEDVVVKAPSWRAHTNLGWFYQSQGEENLAEQHYKKALRLAPLNYLTSSNLGTLYSQQGQIEKARWYHDIAVTLETHTTIGLEARAEHFLATESYSEARADLQRALPRTMKPRKVHQRLTQANAGLGDWRASITHTLAARNLGHVDTANQIIHMVRPFWASREQALLGIQYFSALDGQWPNQWWVHANWGILAEKVGDAEAAHLQREIANKLPQDH
jgi:hypothetical protein